MSDNRNKMQVFLAASVAVNIFLIAFTLGRFSGVPHAHDRIDGPLPPGLCGEEREGRGGPHGGHGFGAHQRPPSFGPGDLFRPEEMRADETRMRADFDRMTVLRRDFSAKLAAGPVTRDEVLKHFADIDAVMDAVKKEAQEKAAARISTMPADERAAFARRLQNERPLPQPGNSLDAKPPEGQSEGDPLPAAPDQRPPQ